VTAPELLLSLVLTLGIGFIMGLSIAHDWHCDQLADLEQGVKTGRILLTDAPYKILNPVMYGIEWTRRRVCDVPH
jgi:hypothetical protein